MLSNLLKGSWKTTAAAYVGGGIMVIVELFDAIGAVIPDLGNGSFETDKLIAGLGVLGIGWFARDNKVKSETVGAH